MDPNLNSTPYNKRQVAESDKEWLPLLDYASKSGLSLSTLRRYIKAGKISHRLVAGKYFIEWSGKPHHDQDLRVWDQAILDTRLERLEKLENELKKAHKEIVELKTLIAFYEEGPTKNRATY